MHNSKLMDEPIELNQFVGTHLTEIHETFLDIVKSIRDMFPPESNNSEISRYIRDKIQMEISIIFQSMKELQILPIYAEHAKDRIDLFIGEITKQTNDVMTSLSMFLSSPNPTTGDSMHEIEPTTSVSSSEWTGLHTPAQKARLIKTLAPIALGEIETLIQIIETRRFNDPETAQALDRLKCLHSMLGELIAAGENEQPFDGLLKAIGEHKDAFVDSLIRGAKLTISAPAMTFGVVQILSAILGVSTNDAGLVGTIYASVLGFEMLPKFFKK